MIEISHYVFVNNLKLIWKHETIHKYQVESNLTHHFIVTKLLTFPAPHPYSHQYLLDAYRVAIDCLSVAAATQTTDQAILPDHVYVYINRPFVSETSTAIYIGNDVAINTEHKLIPINALNVVRISCPQQYQHQDTDSLTNCIWDMPHL